MFKQENGFTLIEMLFVLMIISILLILIIPTFSSKSSGVHDQGCDALVKVVQAQVDVYQLNESTVPTSLQELVSKDYISDEQTSCSNNKALTINQKGIVEIANTGD